MLKVSPYPAILEKTSEGYIPLGTEDLGFWHLILPQSLSDLQSQKLEIE